MSDEINARIAELVMGLPIKGLGYYGFADQGPYNHINSKRFDTAEEANDSYKKVWDREHKEHPQGYVGRNDWDAHLCYWKDDWGPLAVYDYSTDVYFAWDVVEKMRAWPKPDDCTHTGAYCRVGITLSAKGVVCSWERWGYSYKGDATTMPLAVCKAALCAVGGR